MPRVNKRKTDPTNRDHIDECIQYMISSGVGLNAASKEYAIPEATLRRHKKKSTEGVTIGVHGGLGSSRVTKGNCISCKDVSLSWIWIYEEGIAVIY
jgi:hypothetical protein